MGKLITLRGKNGYLVKGEILEEWEIIKKYCELHPNAVCVGGYGYRGCRPKGTKIKNYIQYDVQKGKS